MLPRAQRIDTDRGLVLIVLTPVDQHLFDAHLLLHVRDNQVGMLLLQQPRQRMRKRLGAVIAGGRMQRNIDLQPLGTGGLGETLQSEVFENLAQP